MESRRENVDLVAQAGNEFMWVLEAEGRIAGYTTIMTQAPPKDWTPEEPSLYLFTTVTDPAYREYKRGTVIALWAVDQAAR